MNRNVIVNFRTLVLCLMIGFFSGCVEETEKKVPISEETVHLDNGNSKKESPSIACKPVSGEITVKLAGIAVDLKENESAYQGDLLILHGWNENRNNWCSHSRLCIKARNKGFRVIMPEMGKSVYAKGIYPETRSDWKAYPSAQFLIDTLIPALQQEYCLLQNDGYNMVVGVSAGARGVIRLVQNLPNLFVGAVALSGDYDPSK
ncbi:MAG TPA: alpha/beta hydrolase, partial [Bacteroidetes bacterium]|nr:alpha/beta hydrolase [Bacteroidota bacterium]